MDLGVLLESPQGSQSSSREGYARALSSIAVAAVWHFPSRGSRVLWLSIEAFPGGFPTRLSHEAIPRGFPTGLSHVPPWCELILGLKVEAVQGKQDFLELTETSGGLWEWWHDREFLSPFLWRVTPENSFAITLGKDPSSRAMSQKRGSSGCGRDSRASSRVETGMSWNFLSCSKGVKDPLEIPELRCD